MQFLVEKYTPAEANFSRFTPTDGSKSMYLVGKLMAGDEKNLNRRVYPKMQIESAVNVIMSNVKAQTYIGGELNHPDNLSIDLKNVSHLITEAWMNGSHCYGKCKILDTPSGLIAQELVKGGFKLGVSSRGTGNVTNEGFVSDFNFITCDIVAQPSGPGCYPDIVRESVENTRIRSLAEAVREDVKAQEYFRKEIRSFISKIIK